MPASPRRAAKPQGRQTRLSWRPGGLAAALAVFPALGACERPAASETLPEWTPVDHHSQDDDKGQAAPRASAGPKGGDAAQLVELAWRQQCATCHGAAGRGDGPMGPMVHAPDLTQDDWQAKVGDQDIAAVIQTGRNKMPKFDLPDPVVRGLVARIRSLRGR